MQLPCWHVFHEIKGDCMTGWSPSDLVHRKSYYYRGNIIRLRQQGSGIQQRRVSGRPENPQQMELVCAARRQISC